MWHLLLALGLAVLLLPLVLVLCWYRGQKRKAEGAAKDGASGRVDLDDHDSHTDQTPVKPVRRQRPNKNATQRKSNKRTERQSSNDSIGLNYYAYLVKKNKVKSVSQYTKGSSAR